MDVLPRELLRRSTSVGVDTDADHLDSLVGVEAGVRVGVLGSSARRSARRRSSSRRARRTTRWRNWYDDVSESQEWDGAVV